MKLRIANDPIQQKVIWHDIPIDIEWPKGSVREYKDDNGKVTFRKQMYCDYGYIRGTETGDGEEMDVYLGLTPDSNRIFVIEQLVTSDYVEDPDTEPGDFDEWKYMLWFESPEEAQKAYELHMTEDHYGGIAELSMQDFLEHYKEMQDE